MHVPRRLVCLLFLLVPLAPLADASEHQDEERIEVTAENEGNTFWFKVAGIEGRNPALAMRPGTELLVRVQNDGTTIHNLHFGTGDRSRLLQPGEGDTFRVRVAPDAEPQSLMYYWCDPHRDLGMLGTVRLADEIIPRHENEETGGAALLPLIVAGLALVAGARRR